MTAPYRDHIQAIRSALNVDARSMYKASGWQRAPVGGYREERLPPPGDLSKLERFEQDCMTLAFLHHRLPALMWSVLIVRHSLRITDPANQRAELDRLRWATWTAAGHVGYPAVDFARWAVLNWGGKLDAEPNRWAKWEGHELSVRTLKRHYAERISKPLDAALTLSESAAHRILSDAGIVGREAA